MNESDFPVRFDKDGFVPVVTQDVDTAAVLMIGFMNAEALRQTRATGRMHYWSRSRARLWKKGETSGHEQIVDSISINCERNSLLIQVRQRGAVCHDGYPTCYYRRIEDDDSLSITTERWFDPKTVYSAGAQDGLDLEGLTQTWFAAFEYLRDHDLETVSSTSTRLRARDPRSETRIGEELRELSGVLDGSHRHADLKSDVLLEGSQVLYWTAVSAIHAGIPWNRFRPDRALTTTESTLTPLLLAKVLTAESSSWGGVENGLPLDARLHAVAALVAHAATAAGVDPASLIEYDLDHLQQKPYLREFFASTAKL